MARALAVFFLPISGFWGGKVHKNLWFPALDADKQACKIWCRQLYPRRRNPYRTNKHKITQTNSKRYMYTSCLSVCADKNLAYCKVMNGTILRCTRSTVDTVKCPCRREITQYFCNDDDDGDDNACNVLELFSGSSDDTIYLLAIIGGSVAATVVIATLIGIIAWRVMSTSRSSVASSPSAAAQTSPVSSTPPADKWAVHTRVDPSRRDDTGRHNNGYHSDDCDMFYTSHTWSFNIVVCFVDEFICATSHEIDSPCYDADECSSCTLPLSVLLSHHFPLTITFMRMTRNFSSLSIFLFKTPPLLIFNMLFNIYLMDDR